MDRLLLSNNEKLTSDYITYNFNDKIWASWVGTLRSVYEKLSQKLVNLIDFKIKTNKNSNGLFDFSFLNFG